MGGDPFDCGEVRDDLGDAPPLGAVIHQSCGGSIDHSQSDGPCSFRPAKSAQFSTDVDNPAPVAAMRLFPLYFLRRICHLVVITHNCEAATGTASSMGFLEQTRTKTSGDSYRNGDRLVEVLVSKW